MTRVARGAPASGERVAAADGRDAAVGSASGLDHGVTSFVGRDGAVVPLHRRAGRSCPCTGTSGVSQDAHRRCKRISRPPSDSRLRSVSTAHALGAVSVHSDAWSDPPRRSRSTHASVDATSPNRACQADGRWLVVARRRRRRQRRSSASISTGRRRPASRRSVGHGRRSAGTSRRSRMGRRMLVLRRRRSRHRVRRRRRQPLVATARRADAWPARAAPSAAGSPTTVPIGWSQAPHATAGRHPGRVRRRPVRGVAARARHRERSSQPARRRRCRLLLRSAGDAVRHRCRVVGVERAGHAVGPRPDRAGRPSTAGVRDEFVPPNSAQQPRVRTRRDGRGDPRRHRVEQRVVGRSSARRRTVRTRRTHVGARPAIVRDLAGRRRRSRSPATRQDSVGCASSTSTPRLGGAPDVRCASSDAVCTGNCRGPATGSPRCAPVRERPPRSSCTTLDPATAATVAVGPTADWDRAPLVEPETFTVPTATAAWSTPALYRAEPSASGHRARRSADDLLAPRWAHRSVAGDVHAAGRVLAGPGVGRAGPRPSRQHRSRPRLPAGVARPVGRARRRRRRRRDRTRAPPSDSPMPDRTVLIGGSAGGFTVLGVLRTTRVRLAAAAVVAYPVADLADLAERSHRFERHYTRTLVGEPRHPRDRRAGRATDRPRGSPTASPPRCSCCTARTIRSSRSGRAGCSSNGCARPVATVELVRVPG